MTRHSISTGARAFAALIASIAWAGLILQFAALLTSHSVICTIWFMSRFFTITTNLAIALIFLGIAIGRPRFARPRLLAGLTLSILLVGVVYGILLEGLVALQGLGMAANVLLHKVTPVLVPLYWLVFVDKGEVRRIDPVRWAIYPFAYLIYALIRGLCGDTYAYPFIDPVQHGWSGVAVNVAMIALGFLITGHGMAWLDGRLAARRT